jgi:DNA recombination protein RmuC
LDLSEVAKRGDVERSERTTREGVRETRAAVSDEAKRLRDEVGTATEASRTSAFQQSEVMARAQSDALTSFGERVNQLSVANEQRLNAIRETVDGRLQRLQEDNAQKLEQMRATVDEKLQSTLETRLSESFRLVSERLELVHKGLGEMQQLAQGVGDLKKVLSNVKTRGVWGEVQLGALLEQILAPDQYAANVCTTGNGREYVEFAVKLPGSGGADDFIWLPLDSKFPTEDYQRLVAAQEAADRDAVDAAAKALEARVRSCAKDIRDKYIAPPKTTDFGLLFLPTEGLYAEILRRPGLVEALQRDYRVNVGGPTTLAALLNSLRMGFRTLAIQKRSGEVWGVLGGVKTEFTKFGGAIEKVGKKLQEASNAVEAVSTRTRQIERKLKDVEALPVAGEVFDQAGLPALAAEIAETGLPDASEPPLS